MNDVRRDFGQKPGPLVQIEAHDGVLLVDKPSGPTSHDIVDKIRKRFRFRKVGHGGTLDPQATGLLVILLGKGTKLSNRMTASDKVYQGVREVSVTGVDTYDDSEPLESVDDSVDDAGGVRVSGPDLEMDDNNLEPDAEDDNLVTKIPLVIFEGMEEFSV